jgi:hypothetical protein
VLITHKPVSAGTQPLAGSGAGAFARGITLTGAHAGHVVASGLPRPRRAVAGVEGATLGECKAAFRPQSEQYQTLIAPASQGGVGPHPVREPEPV